MKTLLSDLVVILTINLLSAECSVGVKENGLPLVFMVILIQQMEDGQ